MYDTTHSAILSVLRHKGTRGATNIELINNGGGTDTRKRISELRRNGYQILDTWERNGRKRYKRYFLEGTK